MQRACFRNTLVTTVLGLTAFLVPASALADGESGQPPAPKSTNAPATGEAPTAPADRYDGLKGFELMLRPSFGGAGSDSPIRHQPDPGTAGLQGGAGQLMEGASPWSPGFVGQATVGYRFLPFLSAGLRGGIRTASGSNLADAQDLSRTAWDAGFYVRGYPLAGVASVSKYVDPWIGTGVTYMRDTQSAKTAVRTTTGGTVMADYTLDHHAVAIPIAIGVDYRVTRFLSLGPSFEYTIASSVAGCASVKFAGQGPTYCSSEEPGSRFIKANGYGVWTAGLDAKLTF